MLQSWVGMALRVIVSWLFDDSMTKEGSLDCHRVDRVVSSEESNDPRNNPKPYESCLRVSRRLSKLPAALLL
jgi:hypothetical protein